MAASTLYYAGFIALLLGLITLFSPIRPFKITSRRRALVVLGAGVVLVAIALLIPVRFETSNSTSLARFLPNYQFNEFHQIEINSSCERTYEAIKQVRPSEIRYYGVLTWIRRFGRNTRPGILNPAADEPILDAALKSTFVTLSDTWNQEVVFGTVIAAPRGFRPRQYPDLGVREVRDPGFVFAAINFAMRSTSQTHCSLSTETRVLATSRGSQTKFGLYWRAIYPGSALIRIEWLKAIKRRVERP